eukprot:7546298-Lingulodinium_polyedra.AAC.1
MQNEEREGAGRGGRPVNGHDERARGRRQSSQQRSGQLGRPHAPARQQPRFTFPEVQERSDGARPGREPNA